MLANTINWSEIIGYLDVVGIIFGILTVLIPFLYTFVIKPAATIYRSHAILVKSIEEIKKELATNGGSSIKDTVNRIDRRQVMIDKRSKAIFYNIEKAILEVDEKGNILWANELFHKMMGTKNLKGLDWVSHIDEPQREYFLREFESCSEKLRELRFETISTEGKKIKYTGFPYRGEGKNFGFLIYLEGE
jgi:PAS domain-containing protein